jgi:hypothetical protein
MEWLGLLRDNWPQISPIAVNIKGSVSCISQSPCSATLRCESSPARMSVLTLWSSGLTPSAQVAFCLEDVCSRFLQSTGTRLRFRNWENYSVNFIDIKIPDLNHSSVVVVASSQFWWRHSFAWRQHGGLAQRQRSELGGSWLESRPGYRLSWHFSCFSHFPGRRYWGDMSVGARPIPIKSVHIICRLPSRHWYTKTSSFYTQNPVNHFTKYVCIHAVFLYSLSYHTLLFLILYQRVRLEVFTAVTMNNLVRTDVSEELSASFIRVTRIGELGTTLAVTSNRRTLRRNVYVGC